jgi:hypothetical protein
MIVKVQAPLDDPGAPVLVYDEKREWQGAMAMAALPGAVRQALGRYPKAYFYATLVGTKIAFGAQAPEQDW